MTTAYPRSWQIVPLPQLGAWVSGGTPARNVAEYWDGDIPWLGSKDIKQFSLVGAQEHITQLGAANGTRMLPVGAIVAVMRGMSLAKEFRVGITRIPLAINQDLKGIIPDESKVVPEYLARYLESVQQTILGQVETATHGTKKLSSSVLAALQVPLPPLAEQRRIAAILDKADGIRRKRREVVKLADEFLKSAFLEMFGDPVGNPRGWRKLPLAACISAIDPGWSVGGEGRPLSEGERGVLKISAVTSGRFRPSEAKVVEGPIPPSVIAPKRGDLLFSRANTRELVAATCLVDADCPNLFLPDKLWRIRPEATIATTEYLRFLLAHEEFREKIRKQATGSSGSMLNVSQAKVLEVVAPMPPLELQARFGRLVWRHFAADAKLREAAAESDRLFDSLVARAFDGGL